MAHSPLYSFDEEFAVKKGVIIGTDEAGRGPLAGPVVCASVILDLATPIEGLNDSKKLSEKKRENLFPLIMQSARSVSVAVVSAEEIDTLNILRASLTGMYRSLKRSRQPWDHVLVDGNRSIPKISLSSQTTVIKGDAQSASIAAASIVAKVLRDRIMRVYDTRYPSYRFAQHKGYPTAFHRELIQKYGITPIHRKSFCAKFIQQTSLFDA